MSVPSNKRYSRIFIVLCMISIVFYLGCSRGNNNALGVGDPASPIPPGEVPSVGISNCAVCHYPISTNQWLTGAHGNVDFSDETPVIDPTDPAEFNLVDGYPNFMSFIVECDDGEDNNGDTLIDFPDDPDCTSINDISEGDINLCQSCHDQLGDGRDLTKDATGDVERPVVGCESCHGGGTYHFGAGDIPFPKPDHNQCGQCHNADLPSFHMGSTPNAANIVEDYITSPHFASINSHILSDTQVTGMDAKAKCSRCHTDEGFKEYVNDVPGTTGHDDLETFFEDQGDVMGVSPVECRTCHNAHLATADTLERLPESTVSGEPQSRQFNTCTACHQLNKDDGTTMTEAYHDPAVNSRGNVEHILPDSHAAVPGDTRLNSGVDAEALYFVRKGDPNSCSACHNPHSADNTINVQYAQSRHGKPLSPAWTHFDWKAANRQPCQRCHTSTGMKNYADCYRGANGCATVGDYVAANNFTDTPLIAGQTETLYCWACHEDGNYKGALRNPGQVTPDYVAMDNSPITLPDINGSNICVLCHIGRYGGADIANSGANFGSLNLIEAHNLTAGGTLFAIIGYEYSGKNYANKPYFAHDKIGTVDKPDTGENGPCVACHMDSANHTLAAVEKDEISGAITSITSTVCVNCHASPNEKTPAGLQESAEKFEASLEAMIDVMASKGFYYCDGYPFFFNIPPNLDGSCPSPGARLKDWITAEDPTGKLNMGAVFNFFLLKREPGAYAHNSLYARRLIYDSIDWLNGADTVFTTLNAVTKPYKQQAMEFVLADPAIGGRPGD